MPNKIRMHVVHASSEDDSHKAQELNTHSPLTKGWQSGRFCLYPQDLILKLEGRTRIRKIQLLSHHYLISSKVEFFVGDVPEGLDDLIENARYTRLGYVALSENEKTGYRARELKSVHVDAVGTYLKLVLHKNYINRHNLYNQIGIVAINLIGTLVSKGGEPNDEENANPEKTNPNEAVLDQYLQAYFNRPDYVSPLDDLAFDMYQDPEIANIIRKLERKKQEAVINEKFDEAKKIRDAISRLQRVGEKLGRYEVEKRQAIEQEDYERAALKKQQTSEYRHSVYRELNLEELLGTHLAFPPSGQAPHQQLHLPRTSRVDDVKLTDKLAARETERDRERTERERDRTERERELRRKERELREREANLYKPQPAPASFDNDSVPFDERPLPAIARYSHPYLPQVETLEQKH